MRLEDIDNTSVSELAVLLEKLIGLVLAAVLSRLDWELDLIEEQFDYAAHYHLPEIMSKNTTVLFQDGI